MNSLFFFAKFGNQVLFDTVLLLSFFTKIKHNYNHRNKNVILIFTHIH